jgi:hypothetical protein
MTVRTKKLIGVVLILLWLVVYAFIAMNVALAVLPKANWIVELLYYAVVGLAWIIPIGLLLPWMHREPKNHP